MMTKDKLRQLSGDERLGQMRDSEYLGAEDIDDGTEPILTIAGLWYSAFTVNGASTALAVAAGKVPVLGEVTITATAVT